MERFDVVIIGGGPGGGHCARVLARAGKRVLLAERYGSFSQNDFSTAGTPLSTLARFDLPWHVVGARWRRVAILSSSRRHEWEAAEPMGVVLDFAALRKFLADEAESRGARVMMGCRYVAHENTADGVRVTLQRGTEEISVHAGFVVDATGPARAVIAPNFQRTGNYVSGTAVEWLVEVDRVNYLPDTLYFFLGKKWAPQGYSWIFPMGNNRLKVGAGHLSFRGKGVRGNLSGAVEKLLADFILAKGARVIDRHGGVCRYTRGQNDTFVDGRVVGIGDAVSSINLLGGEGIRHAMHCGEVAAGHLRRALNAGTAVGVEYEAEMRAYFGGRWKTCERLARVAYGGIPEVLLDVLVPVLARRYPRLEDLSRKIFDYDFPPQGPIPLAGKFISRLVLGRLGI